MDLKFVINDYILIWNLLFGVSISEDIHNLKQRIWLNYKEEYNNTYRDKNLILKDAKNFIPNDDTIYNVVLETSEYEKVVKRVEKYRLEVMKIWDYNRKKIDSFIRKILRKKFSPCFIFLVNEELDIIEFFNQDNCGSNTLILGKRIDKKEPLKIIVDIILAIVNKEIKNDKMEDDIRNSVIELAVLNEFTTLLEEKSCYLSGDVSYAHLKRQIYPYWLMYMGVEKEKFLDYMARDKIVFDVDRYAYEKELKKMDLEEFIDFCIRNRKYIIRLEKLELI